MEENEAMAASREALRAVRAARKFYPRMELGQLEILLAVCAKPGIRGSEILAQMDGIQSNSVYRTIKTLSDTHGSVGKGRAHGLDLIARLPDPEDSRAFILVPTRRGKQVRDSIYRALKGLPDGDTA